MASAEPGCSYNSTLTTVLGFHFESGIQESESESEGESCRDYSTCTCCVVNKCICSPDDYFGYLDDFVLTNHARKRVSKKVIAKDELDEVQVEDNILPPIDLEPVEVEEADDINPSKRKLRTSKDIYDRLFWDGRVKVVQADGADPFRIRHGSIHVGYKDRFLGICELPLVHYDPRTSDIPFHRIYYFRHGDRPINVEPDENGIVRVRPENWPDGSFLIWDRENRIDLVFRSGNTEPLNAV